MSLRKVVLVGWDGADWNLAKPLMAAGRMPHLARLVERGVMGNLLTLQPVLSPILWTSIATGKRAYAHGIEGFVEPTPDGTGLRPASSTSRRAKALWNITSQSGLRTHAVGWYCSHPAEAINGVCVSNQFAVAGPDSTASHWPVGTGSVNPADASGSLSELRMHPGEIPDDFIAHFIPRAEHLRRDRPIVAHLVGHLRKRLAETLTIQAVATELLEHHPSQFFTVYFEAIDQLGHDFMVYHPPKMPHLPDEVFAAFQHVMGRLYELHDQMLGRIIELAGDDSDVIVVSDHGFLSDHRRPTEPVDPARWHRGFGIFAGAGPSLREDELIHGATLLDVAPTVLTLLGLPVGRDMEGKVLVNAFRSAPALGRIDSWEQVAPLSPHAAPTTDLDDPVIAAAAMKQLVELGYLEAPGEDVLRDIARAKAEARYNLAATYIDGRKPEQAVAIARELVAAFPDEVRHALLLGQAAVPAADPKALAEAIAAVERVDGQHRQLYLFRGFHALLGDDLKLALEHFRRGVEACPDDPWMHVRVGRAALRLRRWEDAERAFVSACQIDPENAEAEYGLSVATARLGRPEEAIEHGLRAISNLHDFPLAHFQLGAVLSRLRETDRAIQAFEICIAMRPQFAFAYRYLARLYYQRGEIQKALHARSMARHLLAIGVPQPTVD